MSEDSHEKTQEQKQEIKEYLKAHEDEGSVTINMAELDVEEDVTANDIAEDYLENEGIYKVTVENASDNIATKFTKTQSRMIPFADWMETGGWEMLDYETELDAEVLNWYYKDTVRIEKKHDYPPDKFYISIKETDRGELPELL